MKNFIKLKKQFFDWLGFERQVLLRDFKFFIEKKAKEYML